MDELQSQFADYLSARQFGMLSIPGVEEPVALLVRYRSRGLEVDCLLPRWADAAYYLESPRRVALDRSG